MENNTEIIRADSEKNKNTGQQRDGVSQKIILFVIGVLVGAVISTGAFLAYIKIAGVGSSSNSIMQGGPGGTPPEMPGGSSNSSGQPPAIPGGSSNSGQSGTPPEMPGNSNGGSSSSSSNNAQNGNS
ncbi:hypothetical protein IKG60_01045 [Candidatus Saccharibacteria bacterium]|nr:hypothetical protein [Candidatus Saccharibacteria bacterium]